MDDWSDDDFKKMMEDCRIVRKRNRIARILSVIALAINFLCYLFIILTKVMA